MKTLDYIHLDAAAVANVLPGLKQLLADYQVFYTNLRGFHWNIKGHGFFLLHEKFEGLYNDTANKIDEIAERMLMLGGQPDNQFSQYLKIAQVQEVANVSSASEAIQNIMDTYSYLIEKERKVLSAAAKAGDDVTVGMMTDYLKEQEKLLWMLVAHSDKSNCNK